MTQMKKLKIKIYYIYIITNIINKKQYIGKRTYYGFNIYNDDYMGSGVKLKKDIILYGKENFSKGIIQICDNQHKCNLLEEYYIDYFNTINTGYNITKGGYGGSLKGRKFGPETCEAHRKYRTGKKHTEETKKKISDAHKGKIISKETIEKWKKREKYIFTEKDKKKISDSCKGEKNGFYGKKHTEETKKKISENHKPTKLSLEIKNLLDQGYRTCEILKLIDCARGTITRYKRKFKNDRN